MVGIKVGRVDFDLVACILEGYCQVDDEHLCATDAQVGVDDRYCLSSLSHFNVYDL